METSRAKTLARNHTVSLRIGFEGPLGTNGLEDNLKDQHQMVDFVLRSCPSIKDLWIRDLVIDPAVLSFAVGTSRRVSLVLPFLSQRKFNDANGVPYPFFHL